jgi:hypothetical protein
MISNLVVAPVDLFRVKAALGSGEEKFCAAILKTLPKDAPELKAWTRAVCLLLLGAEGEALSARDPFDDRELTDPDPDQAAALRFILLAMAVAPAVLVQRNELRLIRRPLFGWNPPVGGRSWGALSRTELPRLFTTKPDLEKIISDPPGRGLDLVSWFSSEGP